VLSVGSARDLRLELFPFISLFLCVIGVLAFLQNLLVMGEIGASEEEALQPQIFQTAYTIECYADRLVLHPPAHSLEVLLAALTAEEKYGLDAIEIRRQSSAGLTLSFAPEFDEDRLRVALNEIVTVNKLAATHRFPYEEYLLFDIRVGGANAYHYIRSLLDTPQYRHVRSGLDITDVSAPAVSGKQ